MSSPGTPALLLGGWNTALPVARSLAAHGVAVHALGGADDPVRRSRAIASYFDGDPEPARSERWLDHLLGAAPRGVVIALSDEGLALIGLHHERLRAAGHRLAAGEPQVVLALLDKARTSEIARDAGLAVPAQHAVRTTDEIGPAVDTAALPCGVKPLSVDRFRAATGDGRKVHVAQSAAELEGTLGQMVAHGGGVVTELVSGAGETVASYVTYVDDDGTPLFDFTQDKLRQYPVGFGSGTYVRSSDDPDVVAAGRRFVTAAGVRGPVEVEFMRDGDGELRLIECNHRMHGQIALVERSGVALATTTYRRALGEAAPALTRRRAAGALWDPIDDVRALRELRRAGRLRLGAWGRSLLGVRVVVGWSIRDPRPAGVPLARAVARRARKAVRRGR